MATVLEAVNFEDHRVAGVAFKCVLRFRAWRTSRPSLSRLDARRFVGCRA
jgi:hypothetical protein